ncbi:MAG: energy-coupling factor transporter transmembrane protein EcfT [Pseudomonadota bacterium]
MIDGFYIPGHSPLHRAAAGFKFLALMLVCALAFLIDNLVFSVALAFAALCGYAVAGMALETAWRQIKPVLFFLAIIFLIEVWLSHWLHAIHIVVRFFALIIMAALVTLTTRASDMLDALESGLRPLRVLGINPAAISLALSLAIRFVPMMAATVREVREAQRARGVDKNPLALAVPTIVRTLKMADDVAAAIDARCYDARK